MPTEYSFICEVHFEPDQFYHSGRGKRRLLKTAVPTIFSHTPRKAKRKPPRERDESVLRQLRCKNVFADHTYCTNEDEKDVQQQPLKSWKCLEKDIMVVNSIEEYVQCLEKEVTVGDAIDECDLMVVDSVECIDNFTVESVDHTSHKKDMYIKELETKVKKLEKTAAHFGDLNEALCKFLNQDQQFCLANNRSMMGYKWSDNTVQKAIKLRNTCGIAGYENLIAQGYPLPSVRTLHRKLEGTLSNSEIENTKGPSTPPNEISKCDVTMDEMSLKLDIEYDWDK